MKEPALDELELVPLLDGPCAGALAEAPKGYDEIWRNAGDLYHLYARALGGFTYAGVTKTRDELAQSMRRRDLEPWLHVEGEAPSSRRARTRFDPESRTFRPGR